MELGFLFRQLGSVSSLLGEKKDETYHHMMVADEMSVDKVHQGKYIYWEEVWECKATERSNNLFQISIEK